MGTHPIFESDFDCLTECSLVTSLKSLPHNAVFPSASAVWLKVASPNHPTSTSTLLVKVWTPTSPVQPWKTSLPPATKPIVSPKSKILPTGMINKWLIWKQLLKLSRITQNASEARYYASNLWRKQMIRYQELNVSHTSRLETCPVLGTRLLFICICQGLWLLFVGGNGASSCANPPGVPEF